MSLREVRRALAVALAAFAFAFPVSATPEYGYVVVHAYPHDPDAFTEGLFYQGGFLYESTGLEGASSIRKVELETGKVVQRQGVSSIYFGEGIVAVDGRLVELTWKNEEGLLYDLATFRPIGRFTYPGEGWGLTRIGRRLVMSDGTSELRFLDPKTLAETGRLQVTEDGTPVRRLNELEYVKGEIFANVWMTDHIARISPKTGRVLGWIDLAGLLSAEDRGLRPVDVLNGIAYDAVRDRLFVTGKLWPKLYEIRLVRKADDRAPER